MTLRQLIDAHYFPLPSQGNIYTFTHIKLANDSHKLLVASLKRELYCFEYTEEQPSGKLKPCLKEISFTYIPSAAEIISMDSFNKSACSNDFVIGITIVKIGSESNTVETYLNIYSEWEESNDFNMESLAQNCLNVELDFIPYHLNHTQLITWDEDGSKTKEFVFLLSGSDNRIHVYKESRTNHTYKEATTTDEDRLFPEFKRLPSVAVWFEILYYNGDKERLSAVGCECGYLRLCKSRVTNNGEVEILFNQSTRFIGSISAVKFQKCQENTIDTDVSQFVSSSCDPSNDGKINLFVVNSVLPGVYFANIVDYGLQRYCSMTKGRKEPTCVASCIELADLDFDGRAEAIVGTSAGELLLHEFDAASGWRVTAKRKVVGPVLGIKYIDLTGDGLRELIAFTTKGVYIFQHDVEAVTNILKSKLMRRRNKTSHSLAGQE